MYLPAGSSSATARFGFCCASPIEEATASSHEFLEDSRQLQRPRKMTRSSLFVFRSQSTTASIFPMAVVSNSKYLTKSQSSEDVRVPISKLPSATTRGTLNSGATAPGSGVQFVINRKTAETITLRFLGREVKILMRLPDGRNVAIRQAVRGSAPWETRSLNSFVDVCEAGMFNRSVRRKAHFQQRAGHPHPFSRAFRPATRSGSSHYPSWGSETRGKITSFGGLSRSDLMSRVRSRGNYTTPTPVGRRAPAE